MALYGILNYNSIPLKQERGSIELVSNDFTIMPQKIVLPDSNTDFVLQANAPVPTFSLAVAATDFTTLISENLGNNIFVYSYLGTEYQIKLKDGHYDLMTLNDELSRQLGQNITLSWSENRVKASLQQGFRALFAGTPFGVFLGFSLSTSGVQAHASVLVADWDRHGLMTANLTRQRVGNQTLLEGIDSQDGLFAIVHLLDLRAGADVTSDHLHGNLTQNFLTTFVSFSGLTLKCLIGTYQAVVRLLIRDLNSTIFIHEAYLLYNVVPKALYLDDRFSFQTVSVNLEEVIYPSIPVSFFDRNLCNNYYVSFQSYSVAAQMFNRDQSEVTSSLMGTKVQGFGNDGLAIFDDLYIDLLTGSPFFLQICMQDLGFCVNTSNITVVPTRLNFDSRTLFPSSYEFIDTILLTFVNSKGESLIVIPEDRFKIKMSLLQNDITGHGYVQGPTIVNFSQAFNAFAFQKLSLIGMGKKYTLFFEHVGGIAWVSSPEFSLQNGGFLVASNISNHFCGQQLGVFTVTLEPKIPELPLDLYILSNPTVSVEIDSATDATVTLTGTVQIPLIQRNARFTDVSIELGALSKCPSTYTLRFQLNVESVVLFTVNSNQFILLPYNLFVPWNVTTYFPDILDVKIRDYDMKIDTVAQDVQVSARLTRIRPSFAINNSVGLYISLENAYMPYASALSGITTESVVNGTARFAGIRPVKKAGRGYRLEFHAEFPFSRLVFASTWNFTVLPSQLLFLSQSLLSNVSLGKTLPPLLVSIVDSFGNVVDGLSEADAFAMNFSVFRSTVNCSACSTCREFSSAIRITINSTISSSHLPVVRVSPTFDLTVTGAAFTTKIICQTSSYVGASNRIHVSLISNVDLYGKDGSVISITGLYASGTSYPEIPLYSQNRDIFTVAKWYRAMGTLIVSIPLNSTLSSGILYEFSFVLQNPSFISTSSVQIASSGSHFISKSKFESGNCAQPFQTSSYLVTELKVAQSSRDPASRNLISISFLSNAEFQCGVNQCIVRGLTSTFVYEDNSFVSNCSLSLDHWDNVTGNLFIVTGNDQVLPGACHLEFAVRNPCVARESEAVLLQLNESMYGMTYNQLVASDGPLIAVSYVYDNLFPCANNTLRTSVSSNYDLVTGFILRISAPSAVNFSQLATLRFNCLLNTSSSGYAELCSPSGSSNHPSYACMDVDCSNPAVGCFLQESIGVSSVDTNGSTVELSVNYSLHAGQSVEVSLNLTNPSTGNMNVSIALFAIDVRSPLPIGVSAYQIVRDSCSAVREVLSSGLAIEDPKFSVKEIQQSSSFPGQNNSITLRFSANVDLHSGDLITLSFDGTISLVSDKASPSYSPTSSFIVYPQDGLTLSEDTSRISLPVKSVQAAGAFSQVTFLVQNPESETSIPSLDIYVSVSYNSSCGLEGFYQIAQTKVSTCTAVDGTPSNIYPFSVSAPQFFVKNIGQADPYPGVANSINVTITSNVLIPSASTIVLTNLTGPQSFSLDSNDAHFSGLSFGVGGQVNLTTRVDILAGEPVIFVISFVNPWTAQAGRLVSIACFSPSGVLIIAAVDMSPDDSRVPQRKGSKAGDAAPLKVLEPGFVLADVQSNSSQPGVKMAISVRAAFNFDVIGGSSLSLCCIASQLHVVGIEIAWPATQSWLRYAFGLCQVNGSYCVGFDLNTRAVIVDFISTHPMEADLEFSVLVLNPLSKNFEHISYLDGCLHVSHVTLQRVERAIEGNLFSIDGIAFTNSGGLHQFFFEMVDLQQSQVVLSNLSEPFLVLPHALKVEQDSPYIYNSYTGEGPNEVVAINVSVLDIEGNVLTDLKSEDSFVITAKLLYDSDDYTYEYLVGSTELVVVGGTTRFSFGIKTVVGTRFKFEFALDNLHAETGLLTVLPQFIHLSETFLCPIITGDYLHLPVASLHNGRQQLSNLDDTIYVHVMVKTGGEELGSTHIAGSTTFLLHHGAMVPSSVKLLSSAGAHFALTYQLRVNGTTDLQVLQSTVSDIINSSSSFFIQPKSIKLISPVKSIIFEGELLDRMVVALLDEDQNLIKAVQTSDGFRVKLELMRAQDVYDNLVGETDLMFVNGTAVFQNLTILHLAGREFYYRFSFAIDSFPSGCQFHNLTAISSTFTIFPYQVELSEYARPTVSSSIVEDFLNQQKVSYEGQNVAIALLDSRDVVLAPTVRISALGKDAAVISQIATSDNFRVKLIVYNSDGDQLDDNYVQPFEVYMQQGHADFQGVRISHSSGNLTLRYFLKDTPYLPRFFVDLKIVILPFVSVKPFVYSQVTPPFTCGLDVGRFSPPRFQGNASTSVQSLLVGTRNDSFTTFAYLKLQNASSLSQVYYTIVCFPPFNTTFCPAGSLFFQRKLLLDNSVEMTEFLSETLDILRSTDVAGNSFDGALPTGFFDINLQVNHSRASISRKVEDIPEQLTILAKRVTEGSKDSFLAQQKFEVPRKTEAPSVTYQREVVSALHGRFKAWDFDQSSQVWQDSSGNRLHAFVEEQGNIRDHYPGLAVLENVSGYGAVYPMAAVEGYADTSVRFPAPLLTSDSTICCVARRRAVSGNQTGILYIHYKDSGAFENIMEAEGRFEINHTNWNVFCGQNTGEKYFVLSSMGQRFSFKSKIDRNWNVNTEIFINKYRTSPWAVAEIAVWPRALDPAEIDAIVLYYEQTLREEKPAYVPKPFEFIFDNSSSYCGAVMRIPCETVNQGLCSSGNLIGDNVDEGPTRLWRKDFPGSLLIRDYLPGDAQIFVADVREVGFTDTAKVQHPPVRIGRNRAMQVLAVNFSTNSIHIQRDVNSEVALKYVQYVKVDELCQASNSEVIELRVNTVREDSEVFYWIEAQNGSSNRIQTKMDKSAAVSVILTSNTSIFFSALSPKQITSNPTEVKLKLDPCNRFPKGVWDRTACKCYFHCLCNDDPNTAPDKYCVPYIPYFVLFAQNQFANQTNETRTLYNSPALHARTMTVSGSFFCSNTVTMKGRVGLSSCEASVWESETSIACKTLSGSFQTSKIVMTAMITTGSLTELFSTDHPSISLENFTKPMNFASTGSRTWTVIGINFARDHKTLSTRFSYTATESTSWISDSAAKCMAQTILLGSKSVVITNSIITYTITETISADLPMISTVNTVDFLNMPTTGSVRVRVLGSGLGLQDVTGTGRIGGTASEGTEWESDTSIVCQAAGVTAGSRSVVITAGQLSGSMTEAVSAEVASVSSVNVADFPNMPTTGSVRVRVLGSGLGLQDVTGTGRIGGTASEGTEWESDTSIVCQAAGVTAGSRSVVITAGQLSGSMTEAVSAEVASVSSVNVADIHNLPTTGSVRVRVLGSGLGLQDVTGTGRIGGTASEGTEWESDTSIVCYASAGIGKSKGVSVTVGDRGGSTTELTSYDMSIHIGLNNTRNIAKSLEYRSFTIAGYYEDGVAYTGAGAVGGSGMESSEWVSTTSISCIVPYGGGGSKLVTVTAGSIVGSTTDVYTYDVPTVQSVSNQSNYAGTDSYTVLINGSFVGLDVYTPGLGRIGSTSCEATEWESEEELRCMKGVGGTGASLRYVLTSTMLVSQTLTEAMSHDAPMIMRDASDERANLASTGSVMLTLTGSGLGLQDVTGTGRIGGTASEGTEWESDTSIVCQAAGVTAGSRSVVITAGQLSGSMTEAVSAEVASVSSVNVADIHNLPTTGSVRVRVLGSGLGLQDVTGTGRIGGTASEGTEWESDTSIVCQAAGVTAGSRSVVITAGQLSGSMTEAVSAEVASVSSVNVADFPNMPTTGSVRVRVLGSGLGLQDVTGTGRIGGTASEGTEWESDTSIVCQAAGVTAGSRSVVITAGQLSGSMTEAVSAEVASVSSVNVADFPNMPTTGSVRVRVLGSGLGLQDVTGTGRIGGTASEGTEWESDTSIVCYASAGIGKSKGVSVTVGDRGGSTTELTSYDMSIHIGLNNTRNIAKSLEYRSFTIAGYYEDGVAYTGAGAVGGSGMESSEWVSTTSISCIVPYGGGGSKLVTVTAGSIVGSTTDVYTYDVPTVQSVSNQSNYAGTDSYTVLINGSFVGLDVYTPGLGRIGSTSCEATEWESEEELRCMKGVGGTGASLRYVLTSTMLVSQTLTEAMSHDAPMIMRDASDERANLASTGSVMLTLTGSGLGLQDVTGTGRIGGTASEGTEWESDTSIVCQAAGVTAGSRSVVITAGQLSGSMTEAVSAEVASVSSVNVADIHNLPTTGSVRVRVLGSGLGLQDVTGTGRIGGTASEGTEWESDTSIVCYASAGIGKSKGVSVTVGDRGGSTTELTSYDMSIHIGLNNTRNIAKSLEYRSFTIAGYYEDGVAYTGAGAVGGSGMESSEWVSTTSISCIVPYGGGGSKLVTVTAGSIVGSTTDVYTYDVPTVQSVSNQSNYAGTDSYTVLINGSFVGLDVYTPGLGRIGSTSCEATEWESEEELRCMKGVGGTGASLRYVLTSTMLVSQTLTEAMSHDAPMIMRDASDERANLASTGSVMLTLTGSGLGLQDVTGTGRIGGTASEGTEWESDTSIVCYASAGIGKSKGVSVTVGDRGGSTTELTSYDMSIHIGLNNTRNIAKALEYRSFTIAGYYEDGVAYTGAGAVGGSGMESSEWVSTTSISCIVPYGGGGSKLVTVTAGSIVGSTTDVFTFDFPVLRSAAKIDGNSYFVVLNGSFVGLDVYTPGLGRIGSTSCEATEWESEEELRCMKGQGRISGSLAVVVTSQSAVSSLTQAFSSDLISFVNFSASNSPTVGGLNVSLYADTFGTQGSLASRIGLTSNMMTNWVSTSALQVKVESGVLSNLKAVVTSEVLASSSALKFSYDIPQLLSLEASGSDSALWIAESNSSRTYTGGNDLTVVGSGFGTVDFTPTVLVGSQSCLSVLWLADTFLVCKTPAASWSSGSCADGLCVSNQPVTVDLLQQVSNEPCSDNLAWSDIAGKTCVDYTANAAAISNKYDCGWNKTITVSTGTITDGDSDYINNAICQWYLIPSDSFSWMSIIFDEFETEATYDRVQVYSCSDASCSNPQLELELDGNPTNGQKYNCSGCVGLLVTFDSDFSTVLSGFLARFVTSNSPSWAVDLIKGSWQEWCSLDIASIYSPSGQTARDVCCSCRGENYVYECPAGYHQVGYYQDASNSICQDINDCGIDHDCNLYRYYDSVGGKYTSLRGECVNTEGSFSCVCTGSHCNDVAVKSSQLLDQTLLDSIDPGATVYLLSGNFSSPCNLNLNQNIKLVGASDRSSYIVCDAQDTVFIKVAAGITLDIEYLNIAFSSDTAGYCEYIRKLNSGSLGLIA
ncbi:hypothetical protein GUITHDRAFT_116077 [Guillardia theta CCMP2712]|uniref:CUB domain-containing protein n=1 Tax=Guillardia theta (strain CCMP2712) TaxID=905079 RepID=L1IPP6_GUITC|nr:hypothetical protein GUITHDRAFT_116077 [Guillardia theta CCMP2712]EKX37770.1 hypothetical protein GUITHDRAFT_116077 [Guillardia theta CCMP2712]|eukprot:XP_005824750.1 hypothetical protein GUITHDRAFT_116077 [Guillardia theta CCMP2712]